MSTKHQTTSTQSQQNVYDPGSFKQYKMNIGSMLPQFRQMTANPFNNPFYNQTLRQGMSQANRVGATNMQNMIQGMQQRGIANGSPAAAYLTALQGRNNSALQANAFNNAQNQAANMYGFAANQLMNFHPLQTGSNQQGQQTEKTSGLGTWLPQVAGMAVGAATGGLSGGLTGALGGLSGAMGMGNPFAGGGMAPAMGNIMTPASIPYAGSQSASVAPPNFGGYAGYVPGAYTPPPVFG